MKIDVLTLFPEIINSFLKESIIKRAIGNDIVTVNVIDFRTYSKNKHKKVDDYPYGGGAGMVLAVQPIYDALIDIDNHEKALKILLSPQGEVYSQQKAYDLSKEDHLIILCGHYEGFDERIRDFFDIEISIGDYVLTGGEIAALTIIDSVTRLIPKVLNKEDSAKFDSFSGYLLEHPHYTRPNEFMNKKVPDVLLSGNHKDIKEWREKESIKRTKDRRPDLLKKYKEI